MARSWTIVTSRVFRVVAIALVAYVSAPAAGRAATRTFEFTTNEVTTPGIAVSADGRSVVFNLVGHLFRVPVTGGPATQLTFGPYYDAEPVLSPDGTRIAFISNRDGSDGNIFVMPAAGGRITPVTRDFKAGNLAWSPDGKTIAYVSMPDPATPGGAPAGATLSTIPSAGGTPRRHGAPKNYGTLFFLADGRLAWIVGPAPGAGRGGRGGGGRGAAAPAAGRGAGAPAGPPPSTAMEVMAVDGTVSPFGTIPAQAGQVVLTQKRDGIYFAGGGSLRQYTFGEAEVKTLRALAGNGRIGVTRDEQTAYVAADAKLWKLALSGDAPRDEISWTARVKMETLTPAVPKWTPSSLPSVQVRAVLTPRVSPDGTSLVFMAAGSLWQQPLSGSGAATRLLDEAATYQLEPAFSPDGTQLAFVSDKWGKRELRVLNLATHQTRSLAAVGGASWILFPNWSADGKSILYQKSDRISAPFHFMKIDAQGGTPAELGQSTGNWTARPHLSADGATLFYTARVGAVANVYRLAQRPGAVAEAVTDVSRHVHDGLVSPDGKWLAFRRNTDIMVAPMRASGPLKDADFRRLSSDGGRSFEFSPDSSALIYSEGPHVWRRDMQSGRATEIPIRLTLPRATQAPLLMSRVRVLDLKAGTFSAPTSMFIDGGRIRWIGAEAGHVIPANADRIDGNGRFAIPGIQDSHTHAAWTSQQITEDSLIAYGVTSVRDTGSRLDIVNALRDRAEATNLPIPRYFSAGDIFEGFSPLWGDAFLEITTKDEARDYVRKWKDLGSSFIKAYASISWAVKTEVATEASRLGMPVAGHGLSLEENVRSINLGFISLEHNGANTNDDIVKLFAASGVRLDPTLTVLEPGTPLMLADPATLDAKFRTFIPEDEIKAARPGERQITDAQRSNWQNNTLGAIKKKFDTGVRMLDGTDSLMTSTFHGPSVHWSLQFFAQAGVPAIDVLRMATIKAAETVGAGDQFGSLEVGKLGDAVLLDADPLQDIKNTMTIWRVIKGGTIYDPMTMRK